MSIIGTKIYSDEFAQMIRNEYKILLGFKIPDEQAQRLIIDFYSEFIGTEYEDVLWLSLALTQWNVGRLSNYVREKALNVIDSGSDLVKWQNAIDYKPLFEKNKNRYDYNTFQEMIQKDYEKLREAQDDVERLSIENQIKNLIEIDRFARDEGGIKAQNRPMPHECMEELFMSDLMMMSSTPKRNYENRKKELEELKATLNSPQTYKKVPKPYYTLSPWLEGDVIFFKLDRLANELERYNGYYVLYRAIAVRGEPVSKILNLGQNEKTIVGIYNYLSRKIPTTETLHNLEYIPYEYENDAFLGERSHKGIWLSFYGAKKELRQWEWKVIDQAPEFSKNLPEFYKSGVLESYIIGFGDRLAEFTARAFSRQLESHIES